MSGNEEMIWHVVQVTSLRLGNLMFSMKIKVGNVARKQYEENDVMQEILKCLTQAEPVQTSE